MTSTGRLDPREAPGDAAEEAGIVDQQAVAVQAVHEQQAEQADEGGDGTASDPHREAEHPPPPAEPGGGAPA